MQGGEHHCLSLAQQASRHISLCDMPPSGLVFVKCAQAVSAKALKLVVSLDLIARGVESKLVLKHFRTISFLACIVQRSLWSRYFVSFFVGFLSSVASLFGGRISSSGSAVQLYASRLHSQVDLKSTQAFGVHCGIDAVAMMTPIKVIQKDRFAVLDAFASALSICASSATIFNCSVTSAYCVLMRCLLCMLW